jgi:23S rRNA pseudouridine1911/1915/1917 synthase
MQPQEFIVRPDQAGMPLQDFLAQRLTLSRNKAKGLLDERLVFVNGRRIWMTHHEVRRSDKIEVMVPSKQAAKKKAKPLEILYQDTEYIIVNKPTGRLSNGPDSLESDLQTLLKMPRLQAVHRLDRDTSGCILVAKSKEAFDKAVDLFKKQDISKVYHLLVMGEIKDRERRIDYPLENEPAVTKLYHVSSNPLASHLKASIETGRTHQIRKHLAYIGHPVLGDKTYAVRGAIPEDLRMIDRQMLHATSLRFNSPFNNRAIRVEAPLPKDFTLWMKRLGLR